MVLTEDVEVIFIPIVFGTDITIGLLRRGKGGHLGGTDTMIAGTDDVVVATVS